MSSSVLGPGSTKVNKTDPALKSSAFLAFRVSDVKISKRQNWLIDIVERVLECWYSYKQCFL